LGNETSYKAATGQHTMSTTKGKPQAPGAVTPEKKIELFSGTYFAACMLGGVIGKDLILLHDHRSPY